MGWKCCESSEVSQELLSNILQKHKQWHDMSSAVCRVWLGWLKPKEQLGRIQCGRKNKQTRMNIQTHPHPQETVANIMNLYKNPWEMWETSSNTFFFLCVGLIFLRVHTHTLLYVLFLHTYRLGCTFMVFSCTGHKKTKVNSCQVWNS